MCDPGIVLTTLPDGPDTVTPEPFATAEHPIRKVTRQVAFDGAWDTVRAAKMESLFDKLAADWSGRHNDPARRAPVLDAVDRGGADPTGCWLECGSGSGDNTVLVRSHVRDLVAFDLAQEMLRHAPAEAAPRIQGDSSKMPFADNTFDTILLVNMLLFPVELDRVLAPGGTLLWVNTLGDQTPIHLPAEDVLRAMPGEWSGVTARAGSGFWLSITRDSTT